MQTFLGWVPTGSEWIIILLVVVLLFGAKKLPELARGLGRSLGEFKKAKRDFDREMNEASKEDKEPAEKAEEPPKPESGK